MNKTISFMFQNQAIEAFIDDDGMPWFLANDVCKALGHKNPHEAIRKLVSDKGDLTKREVRSGGQMRLMNFINETAMYELTFGSRLAKARHFRRWVTKEVLPAIRKTGTYTMPTAQPPTKDSRVDKLELELLKARPVWANIKRYRSMGLTNAEIATLIHRGKSTTRHHIRRMEALGLLIEPDNLAQMRKRAEHLRLV